MSASPLTSGVGSNWAGNLVILLSSMPLALTNASHTTWLADCRPKLLPYISCGVFTGLVARDITANGFFWYWAPMMINLPPWPMAAAVTSGAEMPTSALPLLTSTSAGWADGPPAMRLTVLKPASL